MNKKKKSYVTCSIKQCSNNSKNAQCTFFSLFKDNVR